MQTGEGAVARPCASACFPPDQTVREIDPW